MKKILITGASGQLGRSCLKQIDNKYDVLGIGRTNTGLIPYKVGDLTEKLFIENILKTYVPDIVIHLSAMTDVDKCEENPELAHKINVLPVKHLLTFFLNYFVYVSTDYVFDGENGPYAESAITNPLNVYGKTKLDAELLIQSKLKSSLIIRTNVLFDYSKNTQASFVNWIVESLKKRKSISVVDDQYNNPIWTDHLSKLMMKLIKTEKTGIFHTGSKEYINRYEFAKLIAKYFNLDSSLISAISTYELNQIALRPLKGGLTTNKITKELEISPTSLTDALTKISV